MVATTLSRRVSEIVGVGFFAAALVWLVSLTTYDTADAVWFFHPDGAAPPMNMVGRVGAFLAEISYQLVGLTAFLIPVQLTVLGWHAFWCRSVGTAYTKLLGLGVIVGCSAGVLSLAFGHIAESPRPIDAGGYLGAVLTGLLAEYFNRIGSIIVILTVMFLAVMLSTQFSLGQLFFAVWSGVRALTRAMRTMVSGWWSRRQRERQRRDVVNKHLAKTGASSARTEILARSQGPQRARRNESPRSKTKSEPKKKGQKTPTPEPASAPDDPAGNIDLEPPPATLSAPTPPSISAPPEAIEPALPLAPDLSMQERRSRYTSPPISLLDSPKAMQTFDERQLMDRAHLLEEKCREFSVEGSVVQIHPGPVVTTFEFKPDAGVKYSRVTGLADDLCLAMQAESVLIERIPGKSTVGMQIPNAVRDQISLRELLQSEPYTQSSSKLTLALGKTIHGEPVVADLATMPHLLIAGATGTGKSVSLNAMLTSILYRATPEEIRLILIDPKRLELGMYADIPHLLTPVVVDPKQANNALRWAVREMEERYKLLAAEGVRNIGQYNRNMQRQMDEQGSAGNQAVKEGDAENADSPAPLPYVILAIDELADPDDGGEQGCRGVHRPPRPDGPRGRHSPDPGDATALGRRDHGASSRRICPRGSPFASPRRWTRGRFSTATAPSNCSGRETCSTCRRPRPAASVCTVPTSRSARRPASAATCASRARPATTSRLQPTRRRPKPHRRSMTTCTTRPRESSSPAVRPPSPTCSGVSASASAAPPGSST